MKKIPLKLSCGIIGLFLFMVLSPFSHSQEETLLFKDPLNKEPILNPAERATGTLANEICYSFFIKDPSLDQNKLTNIKIDPNQGICWSDGTTKNGDCDPDDVPPHLSGGINFVSANNPKQLFNWGPHLAGKHYIIRFTSMRGNAHPLSFGIRENDSLEGSWSMATDPRYYLAFLNYGPTLVFDSYDRYKDNLRAAKGGAAESNTEGTAPKVFVGKGPFHWKIDIDEVNETVKIFIDEEQKQIMNNVQASGTDRYFHFFYATLFGGTLSDFTVSLIETAAN